MMAPERICPEARKMAKPDAGTSGEPADDGLWANSPGPSGCRARRARGVGGPCRWLGIAFGPPPGGSPPRASNASSIPVRNSGSPVRRVTAAELRRFLLERLGLAGPLRPAAGAAALAADLAMIQIDSIRVTGLRNHELASLARSEPGVAELLALHYGRCGLRPD